MVLHFKVIGVLLILLATVHAVFPKYFKWKEQLRMLSLINRQMMLIHTFFIAFTVFLMGLLCLRFPDELVETEFGKFISLGLGVFWMLRLILQFFGYSPQLWKGKRFETIAHIVFSLLWIYLSIIFLCNYFLQIH